MNQERKEIRKFKVVGTQSIYSIHEINEGAYFMGGCLRAPDESGEGGEGGEGKERSAVVFMYNPVNFSSSSSDSDDLNEKGEESLPETATATLQVIAEVFDEMIIKNKGAVRIYNLTVAPGSIRGILWGKGELWGSGKNENVEKLQEKQDELLKAEDEELTDYEKSAIWWIAWNTNCKISEWGANLVRLEREFRVMRWNQIKTQAKVSDCKEYIGLASNLELLEKQIGSEEPLQEGFFIHPCSISTKKRSKLQEYNNAIIELKSKFK